MPTPAPAFAKASIPREPYQHKIHFTLDSYFSCGLNRKAYDKLPEVTRKLIRNSIECLNYLRNHPEKRIRNRYNGNMADSFIKNSFIPVLGEPWEFGRRLKEFIAEYNIDQSELNDKADGFYPLSTLILTPPKTEDMSSRPNQRQLAWIERIVNRDVYKDIVAGKIPDLSRSTYNGRNLVLELKRAADFLTWLTEKRGVAAPGSYIQQMRDSMMNTGFGPITGRERALKLSADEYYQNAYKAGASLETYLNDAFRALGTTRTTVADYVYDHDNGRIGKQGSKPDPYKRRFD